MTGTNKNSNHEMRNETKGFANGPPCSRRLNYKDAARQNRVKAFVRLSHYTETHDTTHMQRQLLFNPVLFDKHVGSFKYPDRRMTKDCGSEGQNGGGAPVKHCYPCQMVTVCHEKKPHFLFPRIHTIKHTAVVVQLQLSTYIATGC